jgi:hypothetical protein
MNRFRLNNFLVLILLSLYVQSCAYNKGEAVTPNSICNTTFSNLSFVSDIQPILTTNCAISGCHSGATPQGNLNLEASKAYATLSKKGSGYIDVSDPKGSVFYSSIVSISAPMPPNGMQALSACDLKRIETWMSEGAKDN